MKNVSFSPTVFHPYRYFQILAFIAALLVCELTTIAQSYSASPGAKKPTSPAAPAPRNTPTAAAPARPTGRSMQTAPAAQSQIKSAGHVERVGGSVFSTGVDDVIVKILPYSRDRTKAFGVETNESGITSGIYLVSTSPERFIGSNRQGGRVVNLGKVPAGELIFEIRAGNTYQNGPASRNSDGLEHALIRSFPSGTIEIWFEDLPGPARGISDRDFNDVVIQLTGGVADHDGIGELLKVIKEQKGEARDAAISALQQINPKALAQAGVKPSLSPGTSIRK
jgi:hypothetical protein